MSLNMVRTILAIMGAIQKNILKYISFNVAQEQVELEFREQMQINVDDATTSCYESTDTSRATSAYKSG